MKAAQASGNHETMYALLVGGLVGGLCLALIGWFLYRAADRWRRRFPPGLTATSRHDCAPDPGRGWLVETTDGAPGPDGSVADGS